MGIPYHKKENDTDLSGQDARTLGGQDDVNVTKSKCTPLHNKPYFFNAKKENQEKITKKEMKKMKRNTELLPVWGIHHNPEKGLILFSKNKKAIESRMQMIPILEWRCSNVVLTKEELGKC